MNRGVGSKVGKESEGKGRKAQERAWHERSCEGSASGKNTVLLNAVLSDTTMLQTVALLLECE